MARRADKHKDEELSRCETNVRGEAVYLQAHVEGRIYHDTSLQMSQQCDARICGYFTESTV